MTHAHDDAEPARRRIFKESETGTKGRFCRTYERAPPMRNGRQPKAVAGGKGRADGLTQFTVGPNATRARRDRRYGRNRYEEPNVVPRGERGARSITGHSANAAK